MSLLDDFSHSCIIMDKLTKPDGEGGYATEWREGAEFANYVALDSSLEARQAEAQGVASVYTGGKMCPSSMAACTRTLLPGHISGLRAARKKSKPLQALPRCCKT